MCVNFAGGAGLGGFGGLGSAGRTGGDALGVFSSSSMSRLKIRPRTVMMEPMTKVMEARKKNKNYYIIFA